MRHTPLCATDWSIFSSSTKLARMVRWTLPPSLVTRTTVAASSTIPENITCQRLGGIKRGDVCG